MTQQLNPHKRSWCTVVMILGMVPFGLACLTPDDPSCQDNSDCFKGQTCIAQVCQSTDMSFEDMRTNDMRDMTSDVSADQQGLICVVDRFNTTCVDPAEEESSNNDRSRAQQLNVQQRVGCRTGDTPTLFSTNAPINAILCPAEAADYYAVGVSDCRKHNLYVTATLTPTPQCSPGLVNLKVFLGGKQRTCDEPDVTCEQRASGALTVSLKIPARATPQINTVYFATDANERLDVMYQYTLDVESRAEPIE